MSRKVKLDMDKIAAGLGTERRGKVNATSGHFGAMQLLSEVQARFRAPESGGRSTDPAWTERRLVPLAPETLERLERLAKVMSRHGIAVSPLQVAALLLQRAAVEVDDDEIEALARTHAA